MTKSFSTNTLPSLRLRQSVSAPEVLLAICFTARCLATIVFHLTVGSSYVKSPQVELLIGMSSVAALLAGLASCSSRVFARTTTTRRTLLYAFWAYCLYLIVSTEYPMGLSAFRQFFTWLGPVSYTYPLLIAVGLSLRRTSWLIKFLFWLSTLSFPIMIGIVVSHGGLLSTAFRNLDWADQQPFILAFAWPALVLNSDDLKPWQRSICFFAAIAYAVFSVLADTRGEASRVLIALLLVCLSKSDLNSKKQSRRALIVSVGVALLFAIVIFGEQLTVALDHLYERSQTNNRQMDAELFFKDMAPSDYLTGRGTLGTYNPGVHYGGQARLVVDIGWLNLVLKGGVTLLIFVILLTVVPATREYLFSHGNSKRGWAGVIVVFMFDACYQGFISTLPSMTLTWVAIGLTMQRRQQSNIRLKQYMPGGTAFAQAFESKAKRPQFIQLRSSPAK